MKSTYGGKTKILSSFRHTEKAGKAAGRPKREREQCELFNDTVHC